MGGKGGGSLGTLLFSVPLAAIPLMANFGIPQFAPLVASPERTEEFDRHSDERYDRRFREDERDGRDDVPEYGRQAPDSTRRDRDGRTGYNERDGFEADPRQEERPAPLAMWSDAPRNKAGGSASEPFDGGIATRPATESHTRAPANAPAHHDGSRGLSSLTWQAAAQHLQTMGITSYHLEPGSQPLSFLFVCSFCPASTPNVTMRFEAEATEPLDAVADVIAQVDRWRAQQPSAAGTSASPLSP